VQPRAKGFTLIELLVVITIIMILVGILFPVYARTREKANQGKCMVHMRQLGFAMRMYVDDNDGRFPRSRAVSSGDVPVSGYAQYTGVQYPGCVYTVLREYIRDERMLKCPTRNTTWYYTYRATGDAYEFSYPYNEICWRRYKSRGVRESDIAVPSKQVLLTEGYHLWFSRHSHIYDRLGAGFFLPNRYGTRYETDWHNRHVNVVWGDGHVSSNRLEELWYYHFYPNSKNGDWCGPDGSGDCMRPITDGY
jgi:prepilin-type N-terminal cleavage/methylation domain-containing protein/prepilin-type processing-associated H-X9-DG protein